jgi:hypothetical protein
MAKETTSSQSQQKKSGPAPIPGLEEGVARLETLVDQMRGFEKQAIDRLDEAVEQSAELTRGAVAYMARISEAWRQMAIDTARQSAHVFTQAR